MQGGRPSGQQVVQCCGSTVLADHFETLPRAEEMIEAADDDNSRSESKCCHFGDQPPSLGTDAVVRQLWCGSYLLILAWQSKVASASMASLCGRSSNHGCEEWSTCIKAAAADILLEL